MENLNELLNAAGEIGNRERLQLIASLELGERSEAAKRVLYKRERRLELIESGLSFEHARTIVNNEQNY